MKNPLLSIAVACAMASPSLASESPVAVFESAHVRPLALDHSAQRLVAVNTPDNKLTIYRSTEDGLELEGEVPVGLEPVAVALRTNEVGRTEAWVVNHLSDSISIVEIADAPRLSTVQRTLFVGDEPRDIVFAGPNKDRAFITTAHRGQNRPGDPQLTTPSVPRADVWVFDANDAGDAVGGTPLTIVELFGDTPRALAVSPDGKQVYAAVFASGNQTTAIPATVISNNGGLPPAPDGATEGAPTTGLIVKFNGSAWVDETGKDWSRYVPFSLPDRDVFVIDATANPPRSADSAPASPSSNPLPVGNGLVSILTGTPAPTDREGSFSGVGTMLFNMAVRPDNGALYVSNTEAFNEVRFEPLMTGKFAENRITVIKGNSVTPVHLNPHIDYSVETGTSAEIAQSLATPTDMVFSADGSTVFVAAFSSNAVGVFGTNALESGQIEKQIIPVGQGPSGLALDTSRDRLYVMNRLDSSISIISGATRPTERRVIGSISLPYDPTPAEILEGRQFLYDARISSGHGDLSCHTCHVFSGIDQLAWDLGNPFGTVLENPNEKANVNGAQAGGFGNNAIPSSFHPMKGPMTTQALRGLAGAGPMHWRGDKTGGLTPTGEIDPEGSFLDERAAFAQFNGAFVGLQGRAEELTEQQMDAYTDFMLTVLYPPNPVKSLSNIDSELEAEGRDIFINDATSFASAFACNECHALPVTTTGLSASAGFETTRLFKIPHLRNLYDKVGKFGVPVGMTVSRPSQITLAQPAYVGEQIRGFGFAHDGSIDTIDTFLHNFTFLPFPVPGNLTPDPTAPAISPERREALTAFLLSIDTGLAPIVGQQVTVDSAAPGPAMERVQLLMDRAAAGDAELIVKGVWNGESRGALYLGNGRFRTDKSDEPDMTLNELLARASEARLTLTAVPPGNGQRQGIDRDQDGVLDGDAGVPASASPATDAPNTSSSPAPKGGATGVALLLVLTVLGFRRCKRKNT